MVRPLVVVFIQDFNNLTTGALFSALIVTEQRCFANRKRKRSVSHDFANGLQAGDKSAEVQAKEQMEVVTKSVVCGIVTRIDLLEYISNDGTK